ncbi:MAG: hypothetical protein ACI8ZM_000514 [Crocinitomix sp.]|jgi:hypothetical protein
MESSEFTDGMEFDYLMRVIKENHELKQVHIEVLRFFLSEEPQTAEIKNHCIEQLKRVLYTPDILLY